MTRCPSCGGPAALLGPDWRGDRWVECRSQHAPCADVEVDLALRLSLPRRELDALLHPPLRRPAVR